MEARGRIRSSARLSGEATRNPGSSNNGSAGRPAEEAAAAAAAAALRRARAVERAREVEDSPRVLRDKCRRLARALRNAKHLVVYTGAGISTAADIPDYRGPHGVWTRLQRGETVGRVEVSLAQPTFTHMALTALWARGTLKFVASQNCDGLHLRAGLPRRALAELHGDMFCELCAACRRVYLRAFDTTERTARHAHGTRRLCHACGAELRDSIVHFGERGRAAWPLNWAGALRHAARADVVLCLGSSLKVLRRYPRLWRMQAPPAARPALYIVNLQWTPKDAHAALKINARCDAVMRQVARRLRLRVPRYRAAADPLLAHAEPLHPAEAHTTRRPLLAPPAPPRAAAPAPSPDHEDFSSPSASDSDEELPLRRLAERLRAPPRPRPLHCSLHRPLPRPHRRPVPSAPVSLEAPAPDARRDSPTERSSSRNERVSTRNEKPSGLLSSIRRNDSRQERCFLDNRNTLPNERFFLPIIKRPSPNERLSPMDERMFSPNEFLSSNNRNVSPNKTVSLLNERPLSPKENFSNNRYSSSNIFLINKRCSSPHDKPLPSSDRQSIMSDRPLTPNNRPLTQTERPPTPSDRLLMPTSSPNNRLFLANGAPPPPPRPPRPPPDLLRAFQVSLRTGEATILLRAEHAPGPLPPPAAPSPVAPRPAAPSPVAPRPAAPSPAAPRPAAPSPVAPRPAAPSPAAPRPAAPSPVAPRPAAPSPVAPRPAAPSPVAPRPAAPSPVAPRPAAPSPVAPRPAAPCSAAPRAVPPPALAALRSFRMVRPRPLLMLNGETNSDEFTPMKMEITIKKEELSIKKEEFSIKMEEFESKMEFESENDEGAADALAKNENSDGGAGGGGNGARALGSRLRRLLEVGAAGGGGGGGGEEGSEALAAAYIARAVLVCRAQLYPGLHTILAPAPPRPRAECAWCLRRYQARRCLWYGPPRAPPADARARRRRQLCACCDRPPPPPPPPPPAPAAAPAPAPAPASADVDTGGWYGKGYRKGRRKRR